MKSYAFRPVEVRSSGRLDETCLEEEAMGETYHWSDPAMTAVGRAPDDPNLKFSMDAAGNKPPKDSLANMKRPGKDASPEGALYYNGEGEDSWHP